MSSVRADAPLPTPTGWAAAGELRPGDAVFAASGHPTMVRELSFEVPQAAVEAKMVMDPVVVSDDHDLVLGLPWYGSWTGPPEHMVERRRRLVEPLAKLRRVVLELPHLELPLDPWAYGYWRILHLPDGVIAVPSSLASRASELLAAAGLPVARTYEDRKVSYLTSPDLAVALDKVGEWPGFSPEYLRAGADQRRDLLAGVFDARGRFMNGVTVEGQRAVVEDAAELAMSLGLRASMPNKGLARVRMSPHDAVMKLREAELHEFLSGPDRPGYRTEVPYMIRRAKNVPTGDFVSIKTEDGTYLLGKAMIPVRDH